MLQICLLCQTEHDFQFSSFVVMGPVSVMVDAGCMVTAAVLSDTIIEGPNQNGTFHSALVT